MMGFRRGSNLLLGSSGFWVSGAGLGSLEISATGRPTRPGQDLACKTNFKSHEFSLTLSHSPVSHELLEKREE